MVEGGLRLHHVGYVAAEIGPAAEDFCRRLGYGAATEVIHDPLQTALVQFFCLPEGGAWLEIVAPDGPASRLAGAAGKRAGMHHVCYTVGCLEAEIERMRELGMLLIGEPKPAVAFAGRRICWLGGGATGLVELVERRDEEDACVPGEARIAASQGGEARLK